MESIDEIIVTRNPEDQYDLEFIQESDCGNDGKWEKHVFETHEERNSSLIVSESVSPPSPTTQRLLWELQKIVMLSQIDECPLSPESSPSIIEDDSDDEDDGFIHCVIDGIVQTSRSR